MSEGASRLFRRIDDELAKVLASEKDCRNKSSATSFFGEPDEQVVDDGPQRFQRLHADKLEVQEFVQEGQVLPEIEGQFFRCRAVAGHDRFNQLDELLLLPGNDLPEDLLLGRKIVIESGFAHAEIGRDLLHRYLAHAELRETFLCRIKDGGVLIGMVACMSHKKVAQKLTILPKK